MTLLALSLILSACGATKIDPLPCPSRPVLEPLTRSEVLSMDVEVQEKIVASRVALVAYAKKLEIRAGCEDSE